VTGSTTNGTALEEEDMETTLEACDEMLKLEGQPCHSVAGTHLLDPL